MDGAVDMYCPTDKQSCSVRDTNTICTICCKLHHTSHLWCTGILVSFELTSVMVLVLRAQELVLGLILEVLFSILVQQTHGLCVNWILLYSTSWTVPWILAQILTKYLDQVSDNGADPWRKSIHLNSVFSFLVWFGFLLLLYILSCICDLFICFLNL